MGSFALRARPYAATRWRSSSCGITRMLVGRLRSGRALLHLVGKGNKPATMPLTVPVLRVLEACRGQSVAGSLILRPMSGRPIERRDAYRMVARIAKAAFSRMRLAFGLIRARAALPTAAHPRER